MIIKDLVEMRSKIAQAEATNSNTIPSVNNPTPIANKSKAKAAPSTEANTLTSENHSSKQSESNTSDKPTNSKE